MLNGPSWKAPLAASSVANTRSLKYNAPNLMNDLLDLRSQFPILANSTYMISNSLGAMPRAVYDSMRAYADSWGNRGIRAWEEGWWEMAVGVGDKIAPLIGAAAGELSLHQNVTITQAIISSCFDYRGARNKVVMVEQEFPSVQYFYNEQRRHGARIETISSADPVRIDLDKFLAAIDETTLLVPISQVLFRSSYIVNARAIIERAHRVGAYVILDVFQATGAIPLDVKSLEVDFAVGGVLKWLCGGPGVAYLYAREDLRTKLRPALTGWLAHRRPFEFETGAVDRREDSFGFLNGTPHIPALYACQPGLEIINKVGVAAIREKSLRMTARILAGAKSRNWHVNTPENDAERAGTVSVECPNAADVCQELVKRNILVDYRPKAGVRISPHFYNTVSECDFTLQQMDEIVTTLGRQTSGTKVPQASR
ncbi:MAG TPA: aminotransferase class V-fold PLP-dependent enzyme [Candidatus Acidoferrum sp.]|nr:aminotransferase class V-fold PLP-dependent enzyme [Candidatus Acidoferrum sp.]